MNWWSRAQHWRRSHPQVSDAVLSLLVLALGLSGPPIPNSGQTVPAPPSVILLLVLGCAALVVRRRAPVWIWVVTLVTAAGAVAIVGGPVPGIIAVMVAVYTVATAEAASRAVLCAAVTPVVLIATYGRFASAPLLGDATYTLAAVSAMACAIGLAVKSNRAVLAAAEERARVAEQTREELAQRRVTEERLRIARELHDVVAHHIAVINVQSGVARHLLQADPAGAADALGHVRDESAVVLSEMSTILGLLRTSDDADGQQPVPGLADVDALVDAVRRSGTAVTVRRTGQPRELAPGTDLAAYRILQESLTNAGKHGAGTADVTVEYRPDALVTDVSNPIGAGQDDGTPRNGHGLLGMRERVAALGGRLDADARPDGRFVLHVELPAGATA